MQVRLLCRVPVLITSIPPHPSGFGCEAGLSVGLSVILTGTDAVSSSGLRHEIHNLVIVGSNPTTATNFMTIEQQLDKLLEQYNINPIVGSGWLRKQNQGDLKIYELRISMKDVDQDSIHPEVNQGSAAKTAGRSSL